VDVVPPAPSEEEVRARFIQADLKDYGQVLALLGEVDDSYRGIDAVIHLAAIPAPSKAVSGLALARMRSS
jgi:nucleoside-diphosphate-sugar epimerase